MSMKKQFADVRSCADSLTFFSEAGKPTEDELMWGFHAMRTRAGGSDKFRASMNPIVNLFNYHPNLTIAHVFSDSEEIVEDAKGYLNVVRGDIMHARFELA